MRTYSTSGTSDSGSALAASIDTLSLSSEDFTSTDDSHSPPSRSISAQVSQTQQGKSRSSANATPRPPSDDEYEHILVPKSHERASTRSSDSSITDSSVSHDTSRSGVLVGRSADGGVAGDKGKGKGPDAVKEEQGVGEDLRARKARKQREKRARIAELKRLERHSAPSTSGASTSSSVGVTVKTEPVEEAVSRPKRRAGVKSTLRKDRAAVRNELLSGEEGDLSSAESDRQRVKLEPVSPAGPAPRAQDEEDEDEVEGMSDLGAETVEEDDDSDSDDSDDTGYTASTPVIKGRRVYDNRSVMSSEDASSSIDVFLSGDRDFLRDKANKLRLWQALCIELGVVPGGEDLPDLPTASHSTKDEKPDVNEDQHEMPQTLTQASKLLHEEVHINIADYLQARADTSSTDKPDYSALMKPDVESLIRYTRKKKKYIKLDDVKAEWLQPLLKDFGIKRARARGA